MKALKNRAAFSYVMTCVILLICVAFTAVGLQYASIYHTVRTHKESVQLTLDSYITKYSIVCYDALKQGDVYEEFIDQNELIKGAYDTLGFSGGNTQNSGTDFIMERPDIVAITDHAIGVHAQYMLRVPFRVFGQTVAEITAPIEITSKITQK